jgi:N-acetylmuramoyl-L-alanine amidase
MSARRLVRTLGRGVLLAVLCTLPMRMAAQSARGLVVRTGTTPITIPWVTNGATRYVPVTALARALGGTARATGSIVALDACGIISRFTIGQRSVELANVGMESLDAPVLRGAAGALVPVEFITDVLPRYGTGIVWDASEQELRQFSTYARRNPGMIAGTPTPSPVDPDPPRETVDPSPATRADASSAPARTSSGGARGGSTTTPRAGASTPRPSAAGRRRERSVVIDAGHGGRDPGTNGLDLNGRRVYEKDVTLAIALRVATILRERGVIVHMTRTRDTLINLYDRGRIANRQKADLFVSIHVNGANPNWRNPSATRGFETFFLAEAKTEDESRVERMENEAVRFETAANAPAGDPLSFIINDMAQNEHLRESNELAAFMQTRLRGVHPGVNRGVKQANFAVLRGSFMPAVLVETGFASNPSEASYISSASGQAALATSIADAVMQYVASYERRVGGGQ